MNEVIHLEPGSMVVWSSLNGSGFISYQSSTTIRDFKFENDSLVPVNGFFAVNILGELYKKTLTINAVKTFAYPGTYPIVSYFLYFVQKLTASTYVTDGKYFNVCVLFEFYLMLLMLLIKIRY